MTTILVFFFKGFSGISVVSGPFRVAAGQVHIPGALVGQAYIPGSVAGEVSS